MPYDPARVRELLRAAPNHSRMPNGEFVLSLSEQLSEAETQLAVDGQKVRNAHAETAKIQRSLDDEVEASRALRAATIGHAQCIAALRQIATSPKGAQKVAADALKAAGIVIESAPTAK